MKYFKLTYLQIGLRNKGGRSKGTITVNYRGSLIKKLYRFIDTKRRIFPKIPATLLAPYIYNSNTSAYISLIMFPNGVLTYILASQYSVNQTKIYNLYQPSVNQEKGWSNLLNTFSIGSIIHNIELNPYHGGQLIRAAGTSALVLRKTNDNNINSVLIKLRSGAHKLLSSTGTAIAGMVSNQANFLINKKKAGTTRLLGFRPRVRPSAMNPVDHIMGGRTKGGCQPQSNTNVSSNKKTTNGLNDLISARKMRLNKKRIK